MPVDHTTRLPRTTRRTVRASLLVAVAIVASACTSGSRPVDDSTTGVLLTRTIDVTINDTYSVTDAPAQAAGGPAGVVLTYNSSSEVVAARGTLRYGNGATVDVNLTANALGMTGSLRVVDPGAGINRAVSGTPTPATFGNNGSFTVSITSGATRIAVSTSPVELPAGTDPAYEALLAAEADYCADAQNRLAGLTANPLSVENVVYNNRDDFAGSKAVLSPLTTRSWSDTVDITLPNGDHGVISNHISCKTRNADQLQTELGVSTTELECAALNDRSFELAMAQLSPAEQAAVTRPTVGSDIVRNTGVQWTTPLAPQVEFDGTTLRAHALLVRWNNPTYALFPDTIRGVHYCTVWSPAYAYYHLRSTLPAV